MKRAHRNKKKAGLLVVRSRLVVASYALVADVLNFATVRSQAAAAAFDIELTGGMKKNIMYTRANSCSAKRSKYITRIAYAIYVCKL